MSITEKRYRCRKCGYQTTQKTNHYGSTHSWERFNTCPKCPPCDKYPEYDGCTIWDCIEELNLTEGV